MNEDKAIALSGQVLCHANTFAFAHGTNAPLPDTTKWAGVNEIVGSLFGTAVGANKGVVWTTGFASFANGERWHGRAGLDHLEDAFPTLEADLYFCIGVLREGATRRAIGEVIAQPLLIVDDIGTKIDKTKWDALFATGCPRPTLEIETSPNNWTWVWALDGDATSDERAQDLKLIRAWLVEGKLTDDVMDAARYIRLPAGWNSKPKYLTNSQGQAIPPPRVTLTAWRLPSDGRVSVEALGEATVGGLSGTSVLGNGNWRRAVLPKAASAKGGTGSIQFGGGGALARTADLSNPDALMRLAQEIGMNPEQIRAGVVDALCPNIAAHTTRPETGFAFLGDGLMQCHHASCQGLNSVDFTQMMLARKDDQEGRVGAGAEWLTREQVRDAGGLADAADAAQTAGQIASASQVRAQHATFAAVAQTRATILSSAFQPVAPTPFAQIPPRRWLYGNSLIAGFVSLLVAAGGTGKSALVMTEAVAMATGRELLTGDKPIRALRVHMHNAEDDRAEIERRLIATLKHYGLTCADLNDNLSFSSGRDMPLKLADSDGIVAGVVDALVERLGTNKIDVLILDPLGAMHSLPENSNEAANLLFGALREIAHRADAAILVLHHAGKAAAMDMDAAGAGASRGASAFVDAARVVRQLVRMTPKEAARFGIGSEDRRDYLRVENGKANLARAEGARWLRMVDTPLNNGMGLWPHGDRVGVVERWTSPIAHAGTDADLVRVQAALSASPRQPRADVRSPEWVGWMVAGVMGLDTGGPHTPKDDRTLEQNAALARVRSVVADWLQRGALIERQAIDPDTRKSVRFVFVGEPAILISPDNGRDDEEN